MRVISGTAKGLRLVAPKSPRVRPALDKVKEAIFDILFRVEGKRVLDLFAGSGSVGIEALSRGAISATFVDQWQPCVMAIYDNLSHTRLSAKAVVIKANVASAMRRFGREKKNFDLIFVDPPYLKDLVDESLALISRHALLSHEGIIVVEHHPKEPITPHAGLALTDSRKYGQTCVSFLVIGARVAPSVGKAAGASPSRSHVLAGRSPRAKRDA